eukprot:1118-Heterococcus_DN1.PRE.1
MEVVKTRFQLAGELAKTPGQRVYKNVLHAFWRIARDEGWHGIQSGLLPGICYQSVMNGIRLSMYAPLQKAMASAVYLQRCACSSPFHCNVRPTLTDAKQDSGAAFFLKNLAAGGIAGGCGAAVGSPFFLVKARLQGQSKVHQIRSAGAEVFHYSGMVDAFRTIVRTEGFRGLFRGIDAAVPRVMVGSAAQLSSYSSCKCFKICAYSCKASSCRAVAARTFVWLRQHTMLLADASANAFCQYNLVLSTGMFEDDIKAYIASSLVAG